MLSDIDSALVTLYKTLKSDEIDFAQLGTDEQAGLFEATDPATALARLTSALDLGTRRDRYVGALGYVLGLRASHASLASVESELTELGKLVLDRFGAAAASEADLRDGLARILEVPEITGDVVASLQSAFGGELQVAPNADGTFTFSGRAAETATMLCELSGMEMACDSRNGTVEVDGQAVPVSVIEFDVCTHAPFDRCKAGVDPRNWPAANPWFFQSVDVLRSSTAASGDWTGVIQEKVGVMFSGTPLVTNLSISYLEQPGLAVTAYDKAAIDPTLRADDGRVHVDFGYVAAINDGVHRRFRVLKVVGIEGTPTVGWICPLWAHQMVMIGWWF